MHQVVGVCYPRQSQCSDAGKGCGQQAAARGNSAAAYCRLLWVVPQKSAGLCSREAYYAGAALVLVCVITSLYLEL
eukprot:989092-Amphidinium_carterae.1